MKNNRTLHNYKGFTLVETLVAILALTIALGSLTLLTARSVQSARDAERRLIAEFLAVEGIEVVQKVFMTNMLGAANGGDSPLIAFADCVDGCLVDADVAAEPDLTDEDCTSMNNNCAIVYDCAVGDRKVDYQQEPGAGSTVPTKGGIECRPTAFRRLIKTVSTDSAKGMFVQSLVEFTGANNMVQKVFFQKEIKDWYEIPLPPTP